MLVRSEIPLVTIDNPFPECGCVMADNAGGMAQLVQYVIGLGHRKIAYIHGPASAVTGLRVKTFLDTLAQHGISIPDEYLAQCEYTNPQSCFHVTVEMLQLPDPPSCILVCDDFSSTGAISAAQKARMQVPEDISLAGYDGIGLMQNYFPHLTTVDQNATRIGQTAARMLISQIEGAPPETTTVPATLISGETVRMM